jgi:membrane protein DedA with SNARE-associated domain
VLSFAAFGALLILGTLLLLGVLGDIFEPIGDFSHAAFVWVRHTGPRGAVFALYAEESGIPVLLPGDVFVAYVGRQLRTPVGWLTAWLALIAAVVLGSTNLYWISRRWGRVLLQGRLGRVVHLTPRRLETAERWFSDYGACALIFGRHIPGFRIPITVVTGTLRVKYRVFAASVAVSSAVWVGVLLYVGRTFGRQFGRLLGSHHVNYFLLLALLAGAALIYSGARRLAAGARR